MPTVRRGGELFWGNDATPMIVQFLEDPQCFLSDQYLRLAQLPMAVMRAR